LWTSARNRAATSAAGDTDRGADEDQAEVRGSRRRFGALDVGHGRRIYQMPTPALPSAFGRYRPAMTSDQGHDETGALPPRTGQRSIGDFNAMYAGSPPWDIGRPQPGFLELAEAGTLSGSVLDAGCGTGEHTLMAAAHGHAATGVDAAPAAIALAEEKAAQRGIAARFLVWDALDLAGLNERYDTVLDSGLFHVFEDDDRARYVDSLAAATASGGCYHMLCFSDSQPGDWGPRRVRRDEIESSFANGWKIETIETVTFDTTIEAVRGWRAAIRRV
jgi:SAM-dependent methyltransferase